MNFLKRRLPPFSRNAWLFLASVVIGGFAFSIFLLYFNLYILARGLDKQALGLLSSIPSAVVLVLGLPLGLLADRLGRKAAFAWGNAGMAVGLVIAVSSAAPGVIASGIFLLGLGQALALLSTAPFIMQVSDERTRTSLFSAQFGLQILAGFGGSLLAGYLPAWLGGAFAFGPESASAYALALLAGGGLMLASNLPLLWIHGLTRPAEAAPASLAAARSNLSGLWRQLTRPLILKLMAPNFIVGFGAAILIPYMNVFFRERHGVSNAWLGLLFSLADATTGVATLLGPQLEQKLGGKVRAVVVAQGSSLLFILLIGFWPGLWVAALAFLLRSALMNMAGPLYQAFSMEQVPDGERSTVYGLQTIMLNVGGTFGPALSGFVQQRYGFAPLFAATTVLYLLGTVMAFLFFRRTESRPRAGLHIQQSGD